MFYEKTKKQQLNYIAFFRKKTRLARKKGEPEQLICTNNNDNKSASLTSTHLIHIFNN